MNEKADVRFEKTPLIFSKIAKLDIHSFQLGTTYMDINYSSFFPVTDIDTDLCCCEDCFHFSLLSGAGLLP